MIKRTTVNRSMRVDDPDPDPIVGMESFIIHVRTGPKS